MLKMPMHDIIEMLRQVRDVSIAKLMISNSEVHIHICGKVRKIPPEVFRYTSSVS